MAIKNIIKQLKNAGTNEKKVILQENNQEPFTSLLRLTYDPKIKFYIRQMPEIPTTGTKDINNEADATPIIDLLMALSKREYTGDVAKEKLIETLSEYTQDTQDIVQLILKKNLDCGINTKLISQAIPGIVDVFEVQKANEYDPDKEYNVKEWYVSAKIDGIRCIKFKDDAMRTRQGHQISRLPLIDDTLNTILDKYNLTMIDGELTGNFDFSLVQSYVLGHKNITEEQKNTVQYCIFAINGKHIVNTKAMYEQMLDISEELTQMQVTHVYVLPQTLTPNDPVILKELCNKMTKQGYEGIMLRHPEIHYEPKRSNALLKYKLFHEADLLITGYFEGQGKLNGTLGGLRVAGKIEGKKIEAEVGSGFNDLTRRFLWTNRDKILGKEVCVRYQEITQNKNKPDIYSLRFPTYRQIKLDR